MTPTFTTGADLLGTWLADVESGTPPVRWPVPEPFGFFDVRPGRLIVLGGAPGAGKTAALLQIGVGLLRTNEAVRLLIANVEMAPSMLLERIVARVAGVPLSALMDRTLTDGEGERVRAAVASLEAIAGRLAFLSAPFTLEHAAAAASEFGANVLVFDYIQRFRIGDGSKPQREQLEDAMGTLRKFADCGAAVFVASAVARQKGNSGSTYGGLNLASFRGSSELEFACDSAYLLGRTESGFAMRCEKNRFGTVDDYPLAFDGTTQTFGPAVELSGLDAFDAAKPAPERGKKAKGA